MRSLRSNADILVLAAVLLILMYLFLSVFQGAFLPARPPSAAQGPTDLSMQDAYKLALSSVQTWNESAHLYRLTSVDLDTAGGHDGSTGHLPNWNLEFVNPDNELYHVEIRNGTVTAAGEVGQGVYAEAVAFDETYLDTPAVAQMARANGIKPYTGKWGRGLNFAFSIAFGTPQICVRGASERGMPVQMCLNAQTGRVLGAAERVFVGGGLYRYNLADGVHQRLLPPDRTMADNIAAVEVFPLGAGLSGFYIGTDIRRDSLVSEHVQLLLSRDGGYGWQPVNTPFDTANAILDIAVADTWGGGTLFVGTTQGLFFTGATLAEWRTPASGLPHGHVNVVVPSPAFPKDATVWATVGEPTGVQGLVTRPGSLGLFKSIDGGHSWHQVNGPVNIVDIALSPVYAADQVVYAVNYKEGLFRSDDGGITWKKLPVPVERDRLWDVELSPAFQQDQTLFVATGTGVFRSRDGGETWTNITASSAYPHDSAEIVRVSPEYPVDRTVVFGTFRAGLVVSRDGGNTWSGPVAFDQEDPTPRALQFIDKDTLLISLFPVGSWIPYPITSGVGSAS